MRAVGQLEERRGVPTCEPVEPPADRRRTKRRAVEQAVAEDGVGDAVRCLKGGDAKLAFEAMGSEVNRDHRQGHLAGAPSVEQGDLHAICLRLDRIEKHAEHRLRFPR